jgi:hypothetical protein
MIKLKDLIKEEHCECGGGCCSTKEQVNEWTDDSFKDQPKRWSKPMDDNSLTEQEQLNEKKVELYFRDDLKNKPISRQGYSEVNGQMRHLEFGIKDLKKSIRTQNDKLTVDNIQYIILKAFQMKEILEKK